MPELVVVADDLTGAAESATHALSRGMRAEVWFGGSPGTAPGADPEVVCVDTDSRYVPGGEAAARAAAGLRGLRSAARVVKKVDSLLRGNIGAEVAALAAALDLVPVVATALPGAQRTVRDGVPLVAGVPLRDTGLWSAEPRPAPRGVAEAIAPLRGVVIPQQVVSRGADATAAALRAVLADGRVPVCDGATDADLDVVVAAAGRAGPRPLLVGSAALVGAVARRLLPRPAAAPRVAPVARRVLVVIGSAAPVLGAQLAQLRPLCDAALLFDPRELVAEPAAVARRAAERLGGARLGLVAVDPAAPIVPGLAGTAARALTAAAQPVAARCDGLVVAGGETARALLAGLHVDRLRPLEEIDPGAVLSQAGHRLVVTRPGSFGSDGSLARIAGRLLPDLVPAPAKELT